MPFIKAPTGDLVRVPSGLSDEEALALAKDKFPKLFADVSKAEEGLIPSIKSGLESFGTQSIAGISDALGMSEEQVRKMVEKSQARRMEISKAPDWEDVKKAATEYGLFGGQKEEERGGASQFLRMMRGQLGESLPAIGATMAGARIGAGLGSLTSPITGPVGPIAGGALGALFANVPMFTGSNIERQLQQQEETGVKAPIEYGAARTGAVAQASLDVASTAFVLGKLGMGKLFSDNLAKLGATAGKDAAEKALIAAAERSLTGAAARGAGKGVVTEMPTEVAQQIIERAQAGLDLFDADAKKEYEATAVGAGALGLPFGFVGGISGRSQARAQQRELEQARAMQAELDRRAAAAKEEEDRLAMLPQDQAATLQEFENTARILRDLENQSDYAAKTGNYELQAQINKRIAAVEERLGGLETRAEELGIDPDALKSAEFGAQGIDAALAAARKEQKKASEDKSPDLETINARVAKLEQMQAAARVSSEEQQRLEEEAGYVAPVPPQVLEADTLTAQQEVLAQRDLARREAEEQKRRQAAAAEEAKRLAGLEKIEDMRFAGMEAVRGQENQQAREQRQAQERERIAQRGIDEATARVEGMLQNPMQTLYALRQPFTADLKKAQSDLEGLNDPDSKKFKNTKQQVVTNITKELADTKKAPRLLNKYPDATKAQIIESETAIRLNALVAELKGKVESFEKGQAAAKLKSFDKKREANAAATAANAGQITIDTAQLLELAPEKLFVFKGKVPRVDMRNPAQAEKTLPILEARLAEVVDTLERTAFTPGQAKRYSPKEFFTAPSKTGPGGRLTPLGEKVVALEAQRVLLQKLIDTAKAPTEAEIPVQRLQPQQAQFRAEEHAKDREAAIFDFGNAIDEIRKGPATGPRKLPFARDFKEYPVEDISELQQTAKASIDAVINSLLKEADMRRVQLGLPPVPNRQKTNVESALRKQLETLLEKAPLSAEKTTTLGAAAERAGMPITRGMTISNTVSGELAGLRKTLDAALATLVGQPIPQRKAAPKIEMPRAEKKVVVPEVKQATAEQVKAAVSTPTSFKTLEQAANFRAKILKAVNEGLKNRESTRKILIDVDAATEGLLSSGSYTNLVKVINSLQPPDLRMAATNFSGREAEQLSEKDAAQIEEAEKRVEEATRKGQDALTKYNEASKAARELANKLVGTAIPSYIKTQENLNTLVAQVQKNKNAQSALRHQIEENLAKEGKSPSERKENLTALLSKNKQMRSLVRQETALKGRIATAQKKLNSLNAKVNKYLNEETTINSAEYQQIIADSTKARTEYFESLENIDAEIAQRNKELAELRKSLEQTKERAKPAATKEASVAETAPQEPAKKPKAAAQQKTRRGIVNKHKELVYAINTARAAVAYKRVPQKEVAKAEEEIKRLDKLLADLENTATKSGVDFDAIKNLRERLDDNDYKKLIPQYRALVAAIEKENFKVVRTREEKRARRQRIQQLEDRQLELEDQANKLGSTLLFNRDITPYEQAKSQQETMQAGRAAEIAEGRRVTRGPSRTETAAERAGVSGTAPSDITTRGAGGKFGPKVKAEAPKRGAPKTRDTGLFSNTEDFAKANNISGEGMQALYDAVEGISAARRDSDWRLATESDTGIEADKAQAVVDRVQKSLPKGVKFVYAPTLKDAPVELLAEMVVQKINRIKGAVMPDGTVVVVGETHKNTKDLEETIAHELIGHYGADVVIGADNVSKLADRLFSKGDAHVAEVAVGLGLYPNVETARMALNLTKPKTEEVNLTRRRLLQAAGAATITPAMPFNVSKTFAVTDPAMAVDAVYSIWDTADKWIETLIQKLPVSLRRKADDIVHEKIYNVTGKTFYRGWANQGEDFVTVNAIEEALAEKGFTPLLKDLKRAYDVAAADIVKLAVSGKTKSGKAEETRGKETENVVTPDTARLTMVRELIARAAEPRRVAPTFAQKVTSFIKDVIATVRNWFRNSGLSSLAKADTKEIQGVIREAERQLAAGRLGLYVSPDGNVVFRDDGVPADAPQAVKDLLSGLVSAGAKRGMDNVKANLLGVGGMSQFVDRLYPMQLAVQRGVKGGLIADLEGSQAMYNLRNHSKATNHALQTMSEGPRELKDFTDKGKKYFMVDKRDYGDKPAPTLVNAFKELDKSGLTPEQYDRLFTLYLATLRVKNEGVGISKLSYLTDKNGKPLVTEEGLAEVEKYVASKPQVSAAFNKAADIYSDYNKGLIDFLAQSGYISKELADELKAKKNYIPFYREKNGNYELIIDNEKTPIVVGNLKDQPHLQALVGGDQKILSIFTTGAQNTTMLTDMALRNLATKDTAHTLAKLGMVETYEGKDKKTGAKKTMAFHKGMGPANPNVLRFKNNGEDVYIVVKTEGTAFEDIPADLLVKGMEGVKTTFPAALELLGAPAKFLRRFILLSPMYPVRQLVKDSFSVAGTSGANIVPIAGPLKQIATALTGHNKTIEKLRSQGLGSGQVLAGSTKENMDVMLRAVVSGKSTPGIMLARLEAMSMLADEGVKAAGYDSFVKQGLNPLEAWLATNEIIDFNRRGLSPSVYVMNELIPFFSAAIQGLSVFGRALTGNMPMNERLKIREKFFKRGVAMAGLTMLYAAMMQDDEAYQNASPEAKLGNWFVRVPFLDEPLRIPIPFEYGLLFKAIPEFIFSQLTNTPDADKLLTGLKNMALQSIPVTYPQVIKPIVELQTGKDLFTGRDIVPKRLQMLDASEQYTDSTTELAKMLGRTVPGISPVMVDQFIKTAGSNTLLAIASLSNVLADGVAKPETPASKTPVFGAAFQPNDAGAIISAVYEDLEEANRKLKTYESLVSKGETARADKYYNANIQVLQMGEVFGEFRNEMKSIKESEDAIRQDPKMTGVEKRKQLEDLRKLKIDVAKQYRDALRKGSST